MIELSNVCRIALLSSVVSLAACAKPATTPPPALFIGGDRKIEREPSAYRFEFIVTAPGEKRTAFSMHMEEGQDAELAIVNNRPLPGPTPDRPQRQDIGFKTKAKYRTLGKDLIVRLTTEYSGDVGDASVVHRTQVTHSALLTPGQKTTVASADQEGRRFDVEITATRLH